jgi:hypothetical protein
MSKKLKFFVTIVVLVENTLSVDWGPPSRHLQRNQRSCYLSVVMSYCPGVFSTPTEDRPMIPDDDQDDDQKIEQLTKQGKEVWTVFWDSGIMAGEETIYRWKGSYWYPSEENGLQGPYKTLRAALRHTELNWVTGATQSVCCPYMPAAGIVAKLEIADTEGVPAGYGLAVNGECWIRTETGWSPEKPQTPRDATGDPTIE